MHKLLLVASALAISVSGAVAQTSSPKEPLSMAQQRSIGESITNDQATPLTRVNFSLAIGGIVPAEIQLRPLPKASEMPAQLQGLNYIMVEEQIALVDPQTRRIQIVIPRWRGQDAAAAKKGGTVGSAPGNAQ